MGSKKPPKPPQLVAPRQVPLSETFGTFLGQKEQLPDLFGFARTLNLGFRTELETGLPGTLGAAQQTTNLVNQLLSGTPSADVQAQAQRQLAERNMAAGLPATSQAAIFGEAASYGKTSMDLQTQGMSAIPGLLQMSEYLSPQQAQNYLFSTGQLRGEQLKAAQDEANIANQNAMNKYNYDVQQSQSRGGLGGTIGGILGAVGGSFIMPGVGTAIGGMLGSGIGSAIGGGGFAPGAGQAGGLIAPLGQMASSFVGGGLMGGGGGALGMPGMNLTGSSTPSFNSPFFGNASNPLNNFLSPSNMGSYGGQYPLSVGGIKF